jgi:RNA-binding protein Musashi
MNNSNNNSRDSFFNDRDSRTPSTNIPFPSQQPNPMSILYQRSLGQVPMMGGGMPIMNLNPMAMAMGMGMNGYNPMGGMNGMNLMGGVNPMNNMNGMANMGALRLGMGPMGGAGLMSGIVGGSSVGGMNGMGVGVAAGMSGVNPNFGRAMVNTGPGPSRITNRGQHNFHPYAR